MAYITHTVWAAGPVPPQLSSKPGATYTIFINFSGFTWNQGWGGGGSGAIPGVVPAYNSDGVEATFSGTEMVRIHEIWSRASEKYAMFDVNVTTVDPASAGLSDYDRQLYYASLPRFQHTVIGGSNSWAGGGTGVSYIDTAQYAESAYGAAWKLNWVFPIGTISNSSQGIAEIIAHENGHALGLNHQSDVNAGPISAGAYSGGTGSGSGSYGPIMGSSRTVTRGLWSRGYDSDLVLVNEVGKLLTNNSQFTVADDGIGHTQGTATPIKAINGTIDFTTAKGMITTAPGGTAPDPTNAAHYTNDYWSFTTTGGNVTLNVMSGRSTMSPGVADLGKTLDAKLTLYDSLGVQVATTSYAVGSFDATITQNLAAGTYYAKVTPTLGPNGTGEVDTEFFYTREFFDIGSYLVTGTIPGLASDITRYWDNASGNGFGTAGGTWAATASNVWNTDSTGNAARDSNVSITTLDAVHFGTDTLGLAAGSVTVSGNVTANRITFGSASGAVTLSGGTITLASVTPTVTVNNATSTIASILAGNAGITKAGTGTLFLSGANTLTGATTINAGTLQLTGNGTLSDVTTVNTSASGTSFDISGITAASESIGSIVGVTGSTIVLGAKNLTIQGATVNNTYAGVISGNGGSLTKVGAETLTLSGNNTFTGGATISGGTLSFNNVGLINTTGNITFTGNGSLQWNAHTQDLSSRIVLTNGVTATIDTSNQNVVFASAIGSSSTGALTKAGSGTLTLSSASTYSGTTTVNVGVLVLNHATALPGGIGATGGTSALTFTGGVLGLGVGDFTRDLGAAGTATAVNFTNAGGWAAYNADRIVNLNNDGHQIVWATANTGFNGQTIILSSSTATHKVTLQNGLNLGTAARTVQTENGTASIDAELSGIITGGTGGALTKSNAGTLALTNTNTYVGATTISGGILEVSALANGGVNSNIGASSSAAANLALNGGTLRYTGATVSTDRGFTLSNNSSIDASGTGSINFANTATPAFGTANATRTLTLTGTNTGNNTLAANLANNGTGAVSVTKTGAGTWILSGSNIHIGTTTVNVGVLVLGHANALPGGIGATGGTGALTFTGGVLGLGVGDFTRNLGTAGTVTAVNFTNAGGWAAYNADRIVNLNNDSHEIVWATAGTGFNGQIVILSASTATHKVTLQNGLNLGTGTRTVQTENGTASIDAELSGVITGGTGGALTKIGAGALVLTNGNTYTGATTVSIGKLFINGNQSLATGNVSVSADATLGGTGTIGGNTTIANNGKLEFNLSTAAGSHDGLDLASARSLTLSSASVLTITSTGGAGPGTYTLVTAPGGINGVVPATVILPPGWAADAPIISSNKLLLKITSTNAAYTAWAKTGSFTNTFTDITLTSNPDGDSLTNLQEFAFGMDPTTPITGPLTYTPNGTASSGVPIMENAGTTQSPSYRAVFARRKNYAAEGISYVVQFSANLIHWVPISNGMTVLSGTSSADVEAVSVPFPSTVPLSAAETEYAPPKFFRVGVSGN